MVPTFLLLAPNRHNEIGFSIPIRFIATKLHPWLPFFYASVMFLNWSKDMKIWSIEDDFNWTYGQVSFLLKPIYALEFSAHQRILITAPCNLPNRHHPIPLLATLLQPLAGGSAPPASSHLGPNLAYFWKRSTMDLPYRIRPYPERPMERVPPRRYIRGNWASDRNSAMCRKLISR